MTAEQQAILRHTISHFQEVARQNRFAENSAIDHDTSRCAICHPELLPLEPFAVYLEVVTQSVKVRRPRLDETLVAEINNDLALMEDSSRVSMEALQSGDSKAVGLWQNWLRDALSTGLGLLSIHNASSYDFDLDEAGALGFELLIQEKVEELMLYQTEKKARL